MSFTAAPDTALRISFPMPAETLTMNQRYHWTRQRRIARQWRLATGLAAVSSGQQLLLPPSWVLLSLPFTVNRRRDPHNYAPVLKHCVDGLVDAGLWPDDTPEWLTTIEPELRIERAGLVVISIWPREADK